MICDTHIHFYDGAYPTAANAVVLADDASPTEYQRVRDVLGIERFVVVQPSAYGLDNSCQLDAMADQRDGRGNGTVRGVMVVDAAVTTDEVRRLTELGVRGARFHMLPGGAVPWDHLETVAGKIAPFGWHIQLQLNGRELAARHDGLARLPTDVVIDHIGRFMPPVGVDDQNFRALVSLVECERAWVKLSAPYESSLEPITDQPADHSDVEPLVTHLVDNVSERLLWASNWPHPGRDVTPSAATLRSQRDRWLPTDELRQQVLVTNPDHLYFA